MNNPEMLFYFLVKPVIYYFNGPISNTLSEKNHKLTTVFKPFIYLYLSI